MLGWGRPRCPCDPAAKQWIEQRLAWLEEVFDSSAFGDRPVVVPTPEFFPQPYDGSEDSLLRSLEQVCQYMGVSPQMVELELNSEAGKLWLVDEQGNYLPHAAGTYCEENDRYTITIDTAELDDFHCLVGTLAHELAHARLLGEGRVEQEVYDNELLTDLTVVYLGLGVFLANSPRNWPCDYSYWPGTDLLKPGYMTPPMYGYALAHLAWFREERSPPWARYLHLNARPEFKASLRYLLRTGDSQFKPHRLRLARP